MTSLTRRAQLDRIAITEPPHFSLGALTAVLLAAAVAAVALVARCSNADAGEIEQCAHDRVLEYAHNSEQATEETALRAVLLTLQVCVPDEKMQSDEVEAEVIAGVRRAMAETVLRFRGRGD